MYFYFYLQIFKIKLCMATKEYNNSEIAKRVEILRKRSGMSVNKMATVAGIDTGNLSRSINGKASFSDRVIYKIANALHVSVDWLENGIEPSNVSYAECAELITFSPTRNTCQYSPLPRWMGCWLLAPRWLSYRTGRKD